MREVLRKEIELHRYCLQFEKQSFKHDRWKGWRYFLFQEADAALLEAGLIVGISQREYQVQHGGKVNGAILEESLIPQMIGQFIGPVGDLNELTINGWRRWKASKKELSPGKAKKKALRLQKEITTQIEDFKKYLGSRKFSSPVEENYFMAEARILEDIDSIIWHQFSRTFVTVERDWYTQNSFYVLDIAKNITGALGNLVGIVAIRQKRPRMNVGANILTTTSGSFIMANPLLSRGIGLLSSKYKRRGLGLVDKKASKQKVEDLKNQVQALRAFKLGLQGDKYFQTEERVTAYIGQLGLLTDHLTREEAEDQKAYTAALGRVSVGALAGGTKVASGVTGIIASDPFARKPKKAGPLLLGGTIAYSTGTAITLVDNLKIETKREMKYRKERKDGVLPGLILDNEIEKLQEIEQHMAKPAAQNKSP